MKQHPPIHELLPVLDEIIEKISKSQDKPPSREIKELLREFQIPESEENISFLNKCSKLFSDLSYNPTMRDQYAKQFLKLGIPKEYISKIILWLTNVNQGIILQEVKSQKRTEIAPKKQVEKPKEIKNHDTVPDSFENQDTDMTSDDQEFEDTTQTDDADFEITDGVIVAYHGLEENLVIPDTIQGQKVVEIGKNAFSEKGLKTVKFPNGIKSIRSFAFKGNQIREVVIPDSVTEIGEYAFSHNQISQIKLPDSITSITQWCFSFNKIEELTIPKGIQSIGIAAFNENQISKLVIPECIKSIGPLAFKNNKLESVILPKNLQGKQSYSFDANVETHYRQPRSTKKVNKLQQTTISTQQSKKQLIYNEQPLSAPLLSTEKQIGSIVHSKRSSEAKINPNNKREFTCWYCEKREAKKKYVVQISYGINNPGPFFIPRCEYCYEIHKKRSGVIKFAIRVIPFSLIAELISFFTILPLLSALKITDDLFNNILIFVIVPLGLIYAPTLSILCVSWATLLLIIRKVKRESLRPEKDSKFLYTETSHK